ncbi:tautomerase family protein [Acuticoccus sp. MNP-M23]|uniref:tautomerase family protein n=1 Tax=Acuticoccus sp. MNP-M23 TaxID=3072793 RepID=UPI002815A4EC|nr:tautomerase family protein [Acuticoccus sp. MNP-M23]WMS41631.1 tautomerase family protein [Acuticoccus sp. MNP-M23]
MPLIRIDILEGRSDAEIETMLDTVQSCAVDAFEVPDSDRYQIVTEHKPGRLIAKDTGLGFERTDKVTIVHVFTSPRTPEMKKKFYRLLADRLKSNCGIAQTDLFVAVTPNGVGDWSFANGEAQYMTGRL